MPAVKKARVGGPLELGASHTSLREIARLCADGDFSHAPARRALDLRRNCYGELVTDLMLPQDSPLETATKKTGAPRGRPFSAPLPRVVF